MGLGNTNFDRTGTVELTNNAPPPPTPKAVNTKLTGDQVLAKAARTSGDKFVTF